MTSRAVEIAAPPCSTMELFIHRCCQSTSTCSAITTAIQTAHRCLVWIHSLSLSYVLSAASCGLLNPFCFSRSSILRFTGLVMDLQKYPEMFWLGFQTNIFQVSKQDRGEGPKHQLETCFSEEQRLAHKVVWPCWTVPKAPRLCFCSAFFSRNNRWEERTVEVHLITCGSFGAASPRNFVFVVSIISEKLWTLVVHMSVPEDKLAKSAMRKPDSVCLVGSRPPPPQNSSG